MAVYNKLQNLVNKITDLPFSKKKTSDSNKKVGRFFLAIADADIDKKFIDPEYQKLALKTAYKYLKEFKLNSEEEFKFDYGVTLYGLALLD